MVDGGSGGNLVSSLDTSGTPQITLSMSTSSSTQAKLATVFTELVHTGQIRLTSARGPDDDGLAGVLARI